MFVPGGSLTRGLPTPCHRLYKTVPTRYADVPISSVFLSLSVACLVRVPLITAPLYMINKVYGQGMKGKDPYEKTITLPKEAKKALSKVQYEVVRKMSEGQMVQLGSLKEHDKVDAFSERDLSAEDDWVPHQELKGRFLQLSSDLTTLRWSYKGYILIEQILNVRRVHMAAGQRPEEKKKQVSFDLSALVAEKQDTEDEEAGNNVNFLVSTVERTCSPHLGPSPLIPYPYRRTTGGCHAADRLPQPGQDGPPDRRLPDPRWDALLPAGSRPRHPALSRPAPGQHPSPVAHRRLPSGRP